jgi:hypothetical protein
LKNEWGSPSVYAEGPHLQALLLYTYLLVRQVIGRDCKSVISELGKGKKPHPYPQHITGKGKSPPTLSKYKKLGWARALIPGPFPMLGEKKDREVLRRL